MARFYGTYTFDFHTKNNSASANTSPAYTQYNPGVTGFTPIETPTLSGESSTYGINIYILGRNSNNYTPQFYIFMSGDVVKNGNNPYGHYIKNQNNAQKQPKFKTKYMDYQYYAIKLTYGSIDYYYIVALEQYQTEYVIDGTPYVQNPVPNTFEPYQTVSFTTRPMVFIDYWEYEYSSDYVTPSPEYDEDPLSTSVSASFSSSYTEPGTETATVSKWGYSHTFSITISDWANKTYEISDRNGSYTVYSGQTVGNDFLACFSVKYTKSNSYHEITDFPKVSLELSKMSKTILSESDTVFAFDYDISDITETNVTSVSKSITVVYTGNKKFVKLAPHPQTGQYNRYGNVVRKKSFDTGDVISDNALNMLSGSLTYNDGTTITLANSNITSSSISVGDSLFTLPHTIGYLEPFDTFSLSYSLVTTYFGTLTFTDSCSTSNNAHIGSVVLEDEQHEFNADDVIDFGSNAKLKIYSAESTPQLLDTITDVGSVAENKSAFYDKYVYECLTGNSENDDGVHNLTFMVYGFEITQKVCFTYDKSITIDISDIQRDGNFFDPEESYSLDISDLTATVERHTNTYSNGTVTTATADIDISSDVSTSQSPSTINTSARTEYTITVSYTGDYSQTFSATFSMFATPILPDHLLISGTSTSTEYYDNNSAVFKYPSGLTFKIVNNDNSQVTISNPDFANDFVFYRDANHTVPLTVGSSVVSSSDVGGNKIYVKYNYSYNSTTYAVYGAYDITFIEDTISSVALADNVNIFLGNRLDTVQSLCSLSVTRASGATGTITSTGFTFTNVNLIMSSADLATVQVAIPGETGSPFTLDQTSKAFVAQTPYAKLTYNFSNFPTEYNNTADEIHPERLVVKVKYYQDNLFTTECEYYQTCEYTSGTLSALDEFTAVADPYGVLGSYTFGDIINITMGADNEKRTFLTITAKNAFVNNGTVVSDDDDNNSHANPDVPIKILEILDITGIKLVNAKTEYLVGETFLNDNDDTEVMIFYNNAQHQAMTYPCKLRQGMTALNIYPLKGTKFTQVVNGKVVNITSATNYNVSVQYTINVSANYAYNEPTVHNAVAVLLDGYYYPNDQLKQGYKCPDGEYRVKYFLVERKTKDGTRYAVTTEGSATGEWKIETGVSVNDLAVLGYLEDIGDETKNARVILFNDYIPQIEGSNNATLKYPCYVEDNADKINKCHFGIMFGNNNSKNRLFVSGNEDEPNCDWHSGQVDYNYTEDETMLTGNYGYFEDLSYCVYGETDNAVVGYDIVSNDKLLVLKDYSDKETTVYFRQPQLVTAINGSGTAVTGLDDETLYQEEFSLSKGNNTVAGISPKSIINFNGDSLFISHDKQVVGLDLTGIIGDNQRYANTRSYFIDEDIKNYDLTDAFLWSNNKYLFVVLKEKVYVTHFELKHDSQYEWFVIDVANVTSITEIDGVIYYGTADGEFFKFDEDFQDAKKLFVGYGLTLIGVDDEAEMIVATSALSQVDENKKYYFKPVPLTEGTEKWIYYSLGTVLNNSSADCDFYVDNSSVTNPNNLIELVCRKSGATDFDRMNLLLKRIKETVPVFINKYDNSTSIIECASGSSLADAWGKKYYFKEYEGTDELHHYYQLIDNSGLTPVVIPIRELYRARLCLRIDEPKEMVEINKTNGTFKLKSEGEVLDIVRYDAQTLTSAFKGEVIEYSNVEAFYITNPYTMGNIEYLKTVWSFTLTNDSNIPSELDLCYATNKIPAESMKTLAYVSKAQLGFNFDDFNFTQVDFDKNVVPRTYTHKRVLSGVKFVCFGFRNYKDTNSVLSSMSLTYTMPFPSYGGD